MGRVRVIPVLLLKGTGLYKSVKFKDFKYVGDPINAIKIFNDKEVDELVVLDISASSENREPNYKLISDFATECFMPVCYGGGIKTFEHAQKIFESGIEKISINYSAFQNPKLIGKVAATYGNQAVVVSIDVKKSFLGGRSVYVKNGSENTKTDLVGFAKMVESEGAGEILLNSIDRDGTYEGYDLDLISKVSAAVSIPVIACGGASSVDDLSQAVKSGASAVAAGSMFVFHGKHRAVLINFPSPAELKEKVYNL